MKSIFAVFFAGKLSKLLIVLFIALTCGAGFAVIAANYNLAHMMALFVAAAEDYFLPGPIIATVGLFALVYVISFLVEFIIQTLQWGGEEKLKEKYVGKLLNVNYLYFWDKQPTEIWSQLNMSTQQTANFCVSFLFAVSSFIMLVFYSVVIFSISVFAGVFVIVAMPFYVLLTVGLGTRFMKLQLQTMDMHKKMSLASQETFADIANIKAKSAYNFSIRRILDVQALITKNMVKFTLLNFHLNRVVELLSIVVPLLIMFAVMNFVQVPLTAGAVLVLFVNVPRALVNFGSVYSKVMDYKKSKAGLSTLIAINNLEAEKSGEQRLSGFHSLETKSVKVTYGNGNTVSIPDIKISHRDKVLLSGASGKGKSTLFNILLGLNGNYEGEVLVNGIELKSIHIGELRRVFGIVFQKVNIQTLGFEDNVLLGNMKLAGKFDETLKAVSISHIYEREAGKPLREQNLSGGEKARIGLAQTFIRQPDVLLIDETFSSVDESMEGAILQEVMAAYNDRTIICISHRESSTTYFEKVISWKTS